MRVESLREQVLEANLELVRRGLVVYTFGNASGISRQEGVIAIKPSGVPYEQLTPEQIVVTDLAGNVVEGNLRPSSDLPTHVELYRQCPTIGGVAHTHSEFATDRLRKTYRDRNLSNPRQSRPDGLSGGPGGRPCTVLLGRGCGGSCAPRSDSRICCQDG